MESSSNFDQVQQQQQHELGRYSSLATQSNYTPQPAPLHEWNPSSSLNNYNHYMNEILPNSKELLIKNANLHDMGYNEYQSLANQSSNSIQNAVDINDDNVGPASTREFYSTAESWIGFSCPDPSSSSYNSYVFNPRNLGLATTSSLYSSHQVLNMDIDFMNYNDESCRYSSKENNMSFRYDHIHHQDLSYNSPSSSNSNKTSAAIRNHEAVPGTKRVSISSLRSQSHHVASKKPRAALQSSTFPLPKVRKEKIGDRIAALHRLVAPFGKTDTTSVLTEAIGYIQFLQDQIRTLSMSCMKPPQSNSPFSLQWDSCGKGDEHELEAVKEDLRSRGLCVVPLSFASYISSSCAGLGGISIS